ncbi:hypothetical protein [Paraburkholderia phytofirmans]|uniref:hypothetical protein n=1 Tax=Paraburkholderia phytofirmans TaxID=261302 RepID=UPI0005A09019|nr:hypothetical protein [Paraburkholderia phytofirmans]
MNFFAQARRGGRSTLFDHIGVMPRDLEMGVGGTPAASAPALDARRVTRVPAIFYARAARLRRRFSTPRRTCGKIME